jgi:hypothetical protein
LEKGKGAKAEKRRHQSIKVRIVVNKEKEMY